MQVSIMGQYQTHSTINMKRSTTMMVMMTMVLALILAAVQVLCLNIQIDQFYSQSFVPNDIFVSFSVDRMEAINFNLSVHEQFPGKLLMHIFVRRLPDEPGGKSVDIVKMKNLDFCKTLETLRNVTAEKMQANNLMPSTFLVSCPLVPGFYFVDGCVFDDQVLPTFMCDGRYFVQIELIQVYEEVIKLLNCKIKFRRKVPEMQPEQFPGNETVDKEDSSGINQASEEPPHSGNDNDDGNEATTKEIATEEITEEPVNDNEDGTIDEEDQNYNDDSEESVRRK